MSQPTLSRPQFPAGYVENAKSLLTWSEVEQRLSTAINYWLCSVRPNQRPHVIPKWAVWVEGKIYFDGSPDTRHARNIALNKYVAVHLESGTEALIVEGTAQAIDKPTRELAQQVAHAYSAKYKALGYAPGPEQWDNGGLFEITPRTAIAWTTFTENPTKFTFAAE